MPDRTLPVLGITGPIGSGKTTVAGLFAAHGYLNLEVDHVGHEVLARPEIRDRVLAAFGPGVGDGRDGINRRELGRLVFASTQARERLNAIMHPPMVAEVERRVQEHQAATGQGVIINAALLYGMKLDRLCRWIIYVQAPSEIRLDRIVTTRGLPVDRARTRLAAQDPEPQGDPRVIFCANDGSLEDLARWVDATQARFLAITPAGGPLPSVGPRTENME